MTSNRKRAASPPPPRGRRSRPQETPAAPRSGKTTALGKRAERPSDPPGRKDPAPATEPSRSKAPSPRAAAGSGETTRDADLPQPMRDNTA